MTAGNAGAIYMEDGARPSGVGGWTLPHDGNCVLSIDPSGNMVVDSTITTKRDCDARLVAVTAVTKNDTLANVCGTSMWNTDGVKYAVPSSSTCVTVDGGGNILTAISMVNLDRAAQMCTALGGVLASTLSQKNVNGYKAMCLAYSFLFAGEDATGTPLTFGTQGVAQSTTGAGYCYTSMDWSGVTSPATGYTAATCPSLQSTTAPFNANFAYDWSVSGTKCLYGKSIAGAVNAALTNTAGQTVVAAGKYIDLSVYTTQGACLANGGSWSNWIGGGAVPMTTATGPLGTYKKPNWDLVGHSNDADTGCLHCHSKTVQYNQAVSRQKSTYINTGHKNMLRKVTAGQSWAGPDGVVYTAATTGPINFTTATATIGSNIYPLLYVFGDWMAAAPAGLDIIVQVGTSGLENGTSNYSCSACHTTGWNNLVSGNGLCSLSSKTTSSACSTAGGTWYPTIGVEGLDGNGYVGDQPTASYPGVTFTGAGNWDLDGINCSRCHAATVGPMTSQMILASQYPTTQPTSGGMGNLPGGAAVPPAGTPGTGRTGLCFGCHQGIAKVTANTGADADLGNPAWNIPVKDTGTSQATYTPDFNGHILGNSFLNSPHARYTGPSGTITGLNSTANTIVPNSLGKYDLLPGGSYDSQFASYSCFQGSGSTSYATTADVFNGQVETIAQAATRLGISTQLECNNVWGAGSWALDKQGGTSTQGTCVTCHDVHQSLFDPAATAPIRNDCTVCHNKPLANMNHPFGSGTPLGDGSDPAAACVKCHMPLATSGGFLMHIFRINTNVNYYTFPTAAQYYGNTQKNANTAPEIDNYTPASSGNTYNNAIWVDIDAACGQCHGGSKTLTNGINQYSKLELASDAYNMHNELPLPRFTGYTDPSVSYQVNFNATQTFCPNGATCTYSWNFGDGSAPVVNGGAIISHAYTGIITPQTVVLTVTAAFPVNGAYFAFNTTNTASISVTPITVNQPPVALGLSGLTITGNTVSFTDASTDNAPFPAGAVSVNWNDGILTTGNAGAVFSHTYTSLGKYTITHTVKDAAGLYASEQKTISLATAGGYTITVNTGLNGVLYVLKYNGTAKQQGTDKTSADAWTFNNVNAGSYTVTVYLAHELFTCNGFTGKNANSGTTFPVTVGPNQTITCTHTP